MINEFYEKRSDIENLLKELGFEKACECVTVDVFSATEVEYWFTEGYIVALTFSGGLSQLINRVIIFKVNDFFVKRVECARDVKSCVFLSEYQHCDYSDADDGFLEVFSIMTADCASRKEKISVVYESMNRFSEQFKTTFNKRLSKLFAELHNAVQCNFPAFYFGDDSSICKSVKVYSESCIDYLLYTRLGNSLLNTTTIEEFNRFPHESVEEKDVVALIDAFAKKCAGIFNKSAIKEYLELCSDYLEETDELKHSLESLSEYPFQQIEQISYETCRSSIKYKLTELGKDTVIAQFDTSIGCFIHSDFVESGRCIFSLKYLEPCVDSVTHVMYICDILYNMLSWFPEKYDALCDIVIAYNGFFRILQKSFAYRVMADTSRNPYYLRNVSSENELDADGISRMDAFNGAVPKRGMLDFMTPSETRITEQMSLLDMISALSGGNPGAGTALTALSIHALGANRMTFMLNLDTLGVYDGKIWTLYEDVCNEDVSTLENVLYNYRYGKLTKEDIHSQIEKRVPFSNLLTLSELQQDFSTRFDSEKDALSGTVKFLLPAESEEE